MYKTNEVKINPLEVKVTGSFEDAFRKFKTLVQNEGILATLKVKETYEKPSIKKRRKQREALERKMLAESREALILSGEWEKRQKRKEEKRQEKMNERKNFSE